MLSVFSVLSACSVLRVGSMRRDKAWNWTMNSHMAAHCLSSLLLRWVTMRHCWHDVVVFGLQARSLRCVISCFWSLVLTMITNNQLQNKSPVNQSSILNPRTDTRCWSQPPRHELTAQVGLVWESVATWFFFAVITFIKRTTRKLMMPFYDNRVRTLFLLLLSLWMNLWMNIPSVRGNAALMLSRALHSWSSSPCVLSSFTTSKCELYEYGLSSSCNSYISYMNESKQSAGTEWQL